MKYFSSALFAASLLSSQASELSSPGSASSILPASAGVTTSRPDSHAPVGVMGDHVHKKGEWMFSYRFMTMHMEDLYRGSDTIANTMAASGYMMTPLDMDMDMHMLGIMYAPSDKLTLMLMTHYLETSMTMADGMGAQAMTMSTSGLGDTSISGLYQFHKGESDNAHFTLGVSLPTGSTDKKMSSAPMPPANGRDQPFPMQLGAGPVGILPAVTYNQAFDQWSWGAQAKASFFLDENNEGYTLGDKYTVTSWIARKLSQNFSVSARLEGSFWDGVDGQQSNGLFTLNPGMSSPADPSNTGGHKIDALIGMNYLANNGARLSLEFGQTIDQDLDGVQLGYDWTLTGGFQFAW